MSGFMTDTMVESPLTLDRSHLDAMQAFARDFAWHGELGDADSLGSFLAGLRLTVGDAKWRNALAVMEGISPGGSHPDGSESGG